MRAEKKRMGGDVSRGKGRERGTLLWWTRDVHSGDEKTAPALMTCAGVDDGLRTWE